VTTNYSPIFTVNSTFLPRKSSNFTKQQQHWGVAKGVAYNYDVNLTDFQLGLCKVGVTE